MAHDAGDHVRRHAIIDKPRGILVPEIMNRRPPTHILASGCDASLSVWNSLISCAPAGSTHPSPLSVVIDDGDGTQLPALTKCRTPHPRPKQGAAQRSANRVGKHQAVLSRRVTL